MISTKVEIIDGLENKFNEIADWIENQPEEKFETSIDEKWSTGQQLKHLVQSVAPINQAFWLPKWGFRVLFGAPNRKPRSFKEVHQKYLSKLDNGGKATAKYIPAVVSIENKGILIKKFKKEKSKLINHLSGWNEEQLDNFLLPHPLLGKLTIREMMFFTIFHTEHHLNSVKKLY